jgi:hypothetical protein
MKPLSAAQAAPIAGSASKFYKADRPRWIDYHIDFFGDGTPARLASIALCGDETLRLPA